MAERPISTVFVGRQREIAELHAALENACAGRGQLVLLAGEPGIGKTRLTEEFAATARQHDAQALWGRCWEGDGAPAFWPWVQIVRFYIQQCPAEALAADLGAAAADIAQVVVEVRDRFPSLPPLTVMSPEQARFRFFDGLTTFLRNAAHKRPLLLILDDLHWADSPSLLLLQFIARELHTMRLLVVGTYRDTDVDRAHPLSEALGVLARESRRLMLSGLAAAEVAQFIEGTTGTTPATNLVTAVHERTEGNPFFMNELVRLLAAEGRLNNPEGGAAGSGSIPRGVRETLRRRLARLTPSCTQLLGAATVIGREFDLDLLGRVGEANLGVKRDQLLALLHEALAALIISEAPGEMGRYRFVHALVRETLYEDISLVERTRLHRHIGEATEVLYAGYLRPHLAALADHFFKAAPDGEVGKAIQYAVQAGERATALLAYEEAIAHYERALQVLPLQKSRAAQRYDLLLALGTARTKAGETQNAREEFQQAAALARELQAPDLLARAALVTARELGMTSLVEKIESQVQGEKSPESRVQSPESKNQSSKFRHIPTLDARPQTRDVSSQPQAPNVFRPEGEYWTVSYGGSSVRLRDAKGLYHLACLLRAPGREFHVMDLLAMTDRESPAAHAQPAAQGLAGARLPDSRTLPDRQARVVYQQRLEELRAELEEAERFNDSLRSSIVQAEIDFIVDELATVYGVGRRAAHSAAMAEKARKVVTNRIRTVLARIQRQHPALGRHLSTTIKTGLFCSYNPERSISWLV